MLTSKQVSGLLNVTEQTLYSWRRDGKGPAHVKLEGQVRYRLSAVQAFINGTDEVISNFGTYFVPLNDGSGEIQFVAGPKVKAIRAELGEHRSALWGDAIDMHGFAEISLGGEDPEEVIKAYRDFEKLRETGWEIYPQHDQYETYTLVKDMFTAEKKESKNEVFSTRN
ncbi:helix-turn-helix transcriptional regulator [Corynebacterium kalinowskii]|nr:helix-turn-helix domain-containing protein [Corynebacterium kalinowskii]